MSELNHPQSNPPAQGAPGGGAQAPLPPGQIQWPETKKRRRFPLAGVVTTLLAVAVAAGALIPLPYVIETPGPTYNTVGRIDGEDVLQIKGRPTFEQNGNLDLTTVYLSGGPTSNVNGFEVLQAMFDSSKAVYREEDIFPKGITKEETQQQNAIAMSTSQEDATAAALNELKIDYGQQLVIASLTEDSPAAGKLETGDVVQSVDGTAVKEVTDIRDTLARGKDKPATVVVDRKGRKVSVDVTPAQVEGRYVLGIALAAKYSFPIDVHFKLEKVGGPSAGMMFALGLISKLSTSNLAGGKHIAGTGTITPTGDVGPIGGIAQKLHGAKASGATLFLAPSSNCGEVVGHVPDGLEVKKVSTLAEALKIVKDYGQGKDLSAYPGCTAN